MFWSLILITVGYEIKDCNMEKEKKEMQNFYLQCDGKARIQSLIEVNCRIRIRNTARDTVFIEMLCRVEEEPG
jgi:hypothetical protein